MKFVLKTFKADLVRVIEKSVNMSFMVFEDFELVKPRGKFLSLYFSGIISSVILLESRT